MMQVGLGRGRLAVAGACVLVLLLALLVFPAVRGPAPGEGQFSIDGVAGAWQMGPHDARFRRAGMGTEILLRAHDGPRAIELSGAFLGAPSDPVFIRLAVNYMDGHGRRFERSPDPGADADTENIDWKHLALAPRATLGRARVGLDVRVCAQDDRCHRIAGHFNARPIVEDKSESLL